MRLRVISSSGQSRLVLVDGDEVLIGRDPDCDLVLDNIFVSRFHARLRRRDEGYELTDLDSRNGVVTGGEPVAGQTIIRPGGEFNVGPFRVQIIERSQLDQVTQSFSPQLDQPAPLVVEPTTHEVFVGGTPVRPRLSRLEFRLLVLLAGSPGAVCEREVLGDAIWGEDRWDVNMLHRLVHRLKEKIEPFPEQPRYVVTIAGVGYRLESGNTA